MQVRYRLVVSRPNRSETIVPVGEHPITIGRLPGSTVCIEESAVSRQHCVVIPTGAGLTVLDQGSTNGTFVNGVQRQHARLQHGDEIGVGKTTLRVAAAPREKADDADRSSRPVSTPPPAVLGLFEAEQQLELLSELARRLSRASTGHEARRNLLDMVLESFPLHRAMLLMQESSGEGSRVRVMLSRLGTDVEIPEDVFNRKLVQRVMSRNRSECTIVDAPTSERDTPRDHWASALCAPLIIEGQCRGALYGDTEAPPPWMDRPEVLDAFTTFANVASLLLQPRATPPKPTSASAVDFDTGETLKLEEQSIQLLERIAQMEHLERSRTMVVRRLIHDVKELVAALNSNHSFIRSALAGGSAELEALTDSQEICKRIVSMAEDVLSMSQMEEGSYPLATRPVVVHLLLARAQRRHAPQARELAVSLALGPCVEGLQVLVDPDVADRVLDNLIGAALLNAGEEGWVVLSAERTDGRARLVVSDSGPSVLPAERDKPFDPACAGDTGPRRHHGLGLQFCRIAAEAHGGTVRLAGSPGDNRVELELPAATEADASINTQVLPRDLSSLED